MPDRIMEGLAFTEDDCRRIISEAWGRFTGQPVGTNTGTGMRNAPGLFGLIQQRRQHLFRQPMADPVLPMEMGVYPAYQSDVIRQKHWELTSRLLESRFKIEVTPSPDTVAGRAIADKAEWVLTYGVQQIQERAGIDLQKALAQGASAYCYGVIHWRVAPELSAKTMDPEYVDDLKGRERKRYKPAEETGDSARGKYRETAASVGERSAMAKARSAFPFHVEIVSPDQVAFIEDESGLPGSALAVHLKEVGIIDYNGKIAADGLKLKVTEGRDGAARLSLEEIDPKIAVGMERPAPVGMTPSIAGWKQRIALACIWSRDEYYELVSATMVTGTAETVINQAAWILVKAAPHGYRRVPYVRAYGTVEEGEWDPALRYRPALDGLYDQKPFYDYTRALEVKIATEIAIKTYFIKQDVNAPPILAGDEEGNQIILTKDSAQAQMLPPGSELVAVGPDDLSTAFVRSRELQGEEMMAAAPQTGSSPITATTQPWTARLGQAQANAYPQMILLGMAQALAEMLRNWQLVASQPAEEGGLGIPLWVPGYRAEKLGARVMDGRGKPIGMNPEDWDGLWLDVTIDPVSASERITEIQLDLQLLNNANGREVMTPEQFVSQALGKADATGYMQEVDAWKASAPWIERVIQQEMAKRYGTRVMVGADGAMMDISGKVIEPGQVLAQNGVKSANGRAAMVPGMGGQTMPNLPALVGNGVAPVNGISG